MTFTVNYVALLVAGIAAFVIGFLWHGPLFGKQWMRLSKMTDADMQAAKAEGMAMQMIVAFIQQLVIAYVLAMFVSFFNVMDVMSALKMTFWIWLGFLAMPMLNGVLWERKSMNLYLFNVVYQFVVLFVMTMILAFWK